MRTRLSAAATAVVLVSALACARHPKTVDTLWDAVLATNASEIPFRFQISTSGNDAQGFFFEGDRKVGSTSGSVTDGNYKFAYDFLNTTLDLSPQGDELVGSYTNKRSNRAQKVRMKKFQPVAADEAAPDVAGSWEMRRADSEQRTTRDHLTWNLYLRQSGPEVSGAILRIDGDTGTLMGRWTNGKLVLSHFAGERGTIFEGTPNPDGTMSVTYNGNAHYTVVRTTDAKAKGIPDPQDPTLYTSVKDPTAPLTFAFPDAMTGQTVSLDDPRFKDKVVIVAIGGSWCPNCHDEAPFLGELYRDYHAKGLEIVNVMFEDDADPAKYRPRVQSFINRFGIEYPTLYGGTVNPTPTTKGVKDAIPQLVNFDTYPTSVYLGRDHRVHSVHDGFASPATGEAHTRLKQEVRELVEKLLAEKA